MEIEVFEYVKKFVWLGAVSHCAEADSAQYHTAQSPTRRSITLRRVRLGAVSHSAESSFSRISSRKRIFQQNHFRLFIRKPNGFDSWKKNYEKISWHCLFKIASFVLTLPHLAYLQLFANSQRCYQSFWASLNPNNLSLRMITKTYLLMEKCYSKMKGQK